MNSLLETLGSTAVNLSRNPLAVIALFLVLIYGIVVYLFGAESASLEANLKLILILFIVLFPVCVLVVFTWLVTHHHTKLYAPGDFKQEELFVKLSREISEDPSKKFATEKLEEIKKPDEEKLETNPAVDIDLDHEIILRILQNEYRIEFVREMVAWILTNNTAFVKNLTPEMMREFQEKAETILQQRYPDWDIKRIW